MKSKFNDQTETTKCWEPKKYNKTLVNKSSVNYNILTNEKIPYDFNLSLIEKGFINRKIKMGEFSDVTRIFRVGLNEQYQTAFNENPKMFRNYNGIFSGMYNVQKYSNIYLPFREEPGLAKWKNQKKLNRNNSTFFNFVINIKSVNI